MRKKLLLFCFLLVCQQGFAQKVVVRHSEETELVSVLCHIAGIDGYVWDKEDIDTPDYFNDVDSVFSSFKTHPSAKFIRNRLRSKGFAWNTPMDFAMKFKLDNGKVSYIDSVEIDGYYDHITARNEQKLLKLIQEFYDDSFFHQFYLAHSDLYSACEEAMQKVTANLDLEWYERFFGPKDNNSFRVIPNLLGGPGNYAVHINTADGCQSVIAVMGCATTDGNDEIHYSIPGTLPILVHEFNHSYCNPLNEEYWNEMNDAVVDYFRPNAEFYDSIAYGNPLYVLNETFVEACMIRYLMSHPIDLNDTGFTMSKLIERYIEIDEIDKKFTMIRDIIDALGKREKNSVQYRTMHDFMPEYVKTVISSAKKNGDISALVK